MAIPPYGLPASQVLALADTRLLVWQPAPDDLRWWQLHPDRQPTAAGPPIVGWPPAEGLLLALPRCEYDRLGAIRLAREADRYRQTLLALSERQRQALLHAIRGVPVFASAELMGCQRRTVEKFRQVAFKRFGLPLGPAGRDAIIAAIHAYGLVALLARPPAQRGVTRWSRRHLARPPRVRVRTDRAAGTRQGPRVVEAPTQEP